MGDARRQKRKAIKEAKENITSTKIEDNMAIAIDAFLKSELYLPKMIELCDELKLERPKKVKSGYELPIFNKNPFNNKIEMHDKAMDLFTKFQFIHNLNTLVTEENLELFEFVSLLATAMYEDNDFGDVILNLIYTSKEKGKDPSHMLIDNSDLIQTELEKSINKIKEKYSK